MGKRENEGQILYEPEELILETHNRQFENKYITYTICRLGEKRKYTLSTPRLQAYTNASASVSLPSASVLFT